MEIGPVRREVNQFSHLFLPRWLLSLSLGFSWEYPSLAIWSHEQHRRIYSLGTKKGCNMTPWILKTNMAKWIQMFLFFYSFYHFTKILLIFFMKFWFFMKKIKRIRFLKLVFFPLAHFLSQYVEQNTLRDTLGFSLSSNIWAIISSGDNNTNNNKKYTMSKALQKWKSYYTFQLFTATLEILKYSVHSLN